MWTRIYLLLVLVRLYFAFSPSYIHPDENFQGPEVIAGRVFGFPHHLTWEFDPSAPLRSAFSLWPIYGLPMVVLRWLLTETGRGEVAPKIVYYTLRGVMFLGSFVLEDWAIDELVDSRRQRRVAMILVASSYVTWTYQTHTFSNSVETLVVLWSVVLIQRILENKERSSIFASGILGFLFVFGLFNRITLPAFIIVPGIYLLPHFIRKPFTLFFLLFSALLTTLLALTTDLAFYNPTLPLSTLLTAPPTPLRSLLYNLSSANLSTHGLHPRYTHLLVNLPLLLGPTLPLLLTPPYSPHLLAPLLATTLLSLIPHQEPRFLLPAIPLFLSAVRLPSTRTKTRAFVGAWVLFNLALGAIYGIFHQGGVVPMQLWLGSNAHIQPRLNGTGTGTDVLWWRTYSPPIWLLDGSAAPHTTDAGTANAADRLRTHDLMGIPFAALLSTLSTHLPACPAPPKRGSSASTTTATFIVVAPLSSRELDPYTSSAPESTDQAYTWQQIHTERRHVNLDDLDFAAEGVWGTLGRVVGRRGLGAWRVGRVCVGVR